MTTSHSILAEAQAVMRSEAAAVAALAERLPPSAADAISLIHQKISADDSPIASHGTLICSGVGKSGLLAQRIAASFASTGTPAHFLHPTEALHGDLGRVRKHDVALLLSYGGESDELTKLLDYLHRLGVPTIAITSRKNSTLGSQSTITIELGPIEEACPLKLAPSTSIACISAVADALVLGVMTVRNFTSENFAQYHPAGSLGRKLLKVQDAMSFHAGKNLHIFADTARVRDTLLPDDPAITRRPGAVILTSPDGKLSGIFTNGDLKRKLKTHPNLLDLPIHAVMTKNPKRLTGAALASEALSILNQSKILDLPVVDEADRPIGMIDVQDLVTLRIVD